MPRKGGQLNDRQAKFCQQFALHGNATRAAEEAGYKDPNHHSAHLMALTQVKTELARLRAKAEAKAELTRDDALKLLAGMSQDVGARQKDRISALALMGKLLGWEAPKRVEHSGPDGMPISMQAMPASRAQALEALRLAAATNPEITVELKRITEGEVASEADDSKACD